MISDYVAILATPPYIRAGVRPYLVRPLAGIVGVALHYTATPRSVTVEQVALYQVGPTAQEQFPAIAYTYYVEGDGTPIRCHLLETRCWHSGAVVNGVARNVSHVGICYAGDVEPNEAQLAGLRECIEDVEAQLGHTVEIEGHRDAPYATGCPGPKWPAWREAILPLVVVPPSQGAQGAMEMTEQELRDHLSNLLASWQGYSGGRAIAVALQNDGARSGAALETGGRWLLVAIHSVQAKLGLPLLETS